MATTTNYGWTTPDDTALVKDGASAIRTLGTSVDTTTKNLNPQTTLGDIAYRSSTSNVNTRLGIGSTGNVLTVAGGVPSWAAPAGGAGNMVQIASGTMTSGSTLSITGLSSYTDILFVVDNFTFTSSNAYGRLTVNNNTTANYARYTTTHSYGQGITANSKSASDSNFELTNYTNILTSNGNNYFAVKLTNCKNAGYTDVDMETNWQDNNYRFAEYSKGIFKVSAAVSSLEFFTTGTTTFTAGNYYVWGA